MSTAIESVIPSASIQDPRFTEAERTRISHRKPDDSHLTRICWMPAFDIDLRHMTGSSFVGAFPDERIPKRTLFFFREGEAATYRQKEIPAMVTNEESRLAENYLPPADQIDMLGIPSEVDKSLVNCQFIINSPRFCANTLMRQYHRYGMCVFEHLNGQEKQARKFFDLILPPDAIPVTERERCNNVFRGPFLDEVLEYLKRYGRRNIEAARKRFKMTGQGEKLESWALRMLAEMIAGAVKAWQFQNATLNKSEHLIRLKRNGKEGKDWYDERDERFDNPLPAPDLVFLADTNRMPLDLQELAAAQKLAEQTGAATSRGIEGALERFLGAVGVVQQADPRLAALEAKFDAILKLAQTRPDLAPELGALLADLKPAAAADEASDFQPDEAVVNDALAEAGIDPEELASGEETEDGEPAAPATEDF
jgi:hypothetical protein